MTATAQQWVASGLIPTSGLAAWNMLELGVSGHNAIYDYSGNGRALTGSPTNAPVITAGVGPNNTAAWYWNGTTSIPLSWTGAITVKHVFILAAAEASVFSAYRGLFTGPTSGDVFVNENSGTKFFDLGFSAPDFEYKKSGVFYANNDQQAPMGGKFELVEGKSPVGITLDGLQIGQQRNLAGRLWKGYFSEMLVYTRELTTAEVARIHLYFNIKYHTFKSANGGMSLYFPCAHIVPQTSMVNNRYRNVPADHASITDSWQYEDAGPDFNTAADSGPRRWEYGYQNVSKQQRVIFDEFWDAAKLNVPFYFHDNDGFTWNKVRIEQYEPNHDGHKRWMQNINFALKGSPTSTAAAETI